jgi:hypothetical protein
VLICKLILEIIIALRSFKKSIENLFAAMSPKFFKNFLAIKSHLQLIQKSRFARENLGSLYDFEI